MPIRILLVSFTVVGVDQATKAFILRALSDVSSIPLIPGIFHLTLVRNPGVAFGLLRSYSFPVALLTTGILLMLLWTTLRHGREETISPAISLGLILGGAMGNLIDRIRWGGVIDFLDFRVWPVFNVADSCVTIGALLMAVSLLKSRRK